MKYLYKDQLKKIKNNLFYFISLSILVFIIAFTYTMVTSSIRRLEENYDEYLEEYKVEDFNFAMGKVDINVLTGSQTTTLCRELDMLYECGLAFADFENPLVINNLNFQLNEKIKENPEVYRELIAGYVSYFEDEYGFTVEEKLNVNLYDGDYTYKFINVTEEVDLPYLIEGELPDSINEIAIYPEFAAHNNISIGDTFTISDKQYLITGFIYKSEFILPVLSTNTIEYDEEKQTIVLAMEETIEALDTYIFHQYVVLGDLSLFVDDFDYESLVSTDTSVLGENMPLVSLLVPRTLNFRIISLPKEVENANAFIQIFLSIFVFFITLLLLIFMRKYIENNEKDIMILRSLGYKNSELTRALLVFPLMISLMTIIGYLFGLLASDIVFNLYSGRYYYPKAGFILYWDIPILTILIPIIVIILVNYLFIYFSLTKKKKAPVRAFRLFRFTPAKTLVTTFIIFLTINVMLIFGLNGNTMFGDFASTTKTGNHFLEMVNLKYLTNEPFDQNYESYTKLKGEIISINDTTFEEPVTTTTYGIDPSSTLKRLLDDDVSKNTLVTDGIIISNYLQTLLKADIGDIVTYKVGEVTDTREIVGISKELIENNFYMDQETVNSYYGLDDTYYNGLFTTDTNYQNNQITSQINYNNSVDEFTSLLELSSYVMTFILLLSVLLSLYVFILVIFTFLFENRINIAILKSVGFTNLEINKKYLVNIYALLLITFIISIPLTSYLLDFALTLIMETVGYKLVVNISLLNVTIAITSLHIIFVLLINRVNNYYNSISVIDVLRHNIK